MKNVGRNKVYPFICLFLRIWTFNFCVLSNCLYMFYVHFLPFTPFPLISLCFHQKLACFSKLLLFSVDWRNKFNFSHLLQGQARTPLLRYKFDISLVGIEVDITSNAGCVCLFVFSFSCTVAISPIHRPFFSTQIICQSAVRQSCPNCLPQR